MKLKAWLRTCVLLTLPSLGLSAASVVVGGGLYQQLEEKRAETFEKKITHEIVSNREAIERLSEQLRLQSPADYGHSRIDTRVFMINSQLAQAPDPIVIVGDSITEAALFPSEICGHPVVNAGIGGSTPSTYAALISYRGLLEPMIATIVVVALGTNNAQKVIPLKQFEPTYRSLIGKLKQKTGAIILSEIPAIKPGTISQYFDDGRLGQINSTIRRLADEFNVGLINKSEPETVDGVHLSATGYEVWLRSIKTTIKAKLGCSPTAEAH